MYLIIKKKQVVGISRCQALCGRQQKIKQIESKNLNINK